MNPNKPIACANRTVNLIPTDLPLSCPRTSERIWDAHPRVFLEITANNPIACPYCGTLYILTPDSAS